MKKINRKATEYSLFLVFVVLIIVTTVIVIMYNKYLDFREEIGTSQIKLLKAYEDGEIVLKYIESAAREAFIESLYNGSLTGFLYEKGCGGNTEYFGSKVLDSEKVSCAPLVKDAIKEDMKKRISLNLKKFSDSGIEDPGYDLYFLERKEGKAGFTLYETPKSGLKVEIDPEFKGKCCQIISSGIVTYFSIDKGECSDYAPLSVEENAPIYTSADQKNCESDILATKDNFNLFLSEGITNGYTQMQNGPDNNRNYLSTTSSISSDECTYCYSEGWRKIWSKELAEWDPESIEKCTNNKCCKAKCPPNAKIIKVPYINQCQPDLRYGKHSNVPYSGQWGNFDACMAMCGPTSAKMILDFSGNTELSPKDYWPEMKGGKDNWYEGAFFKEMSIFLSEKTGKKFMESTGLGFDLIKENIDAKKPFIASYYTGPSNCPQDACYCYPNFGHILTVVGYSQEASNYIILNDPYTTYAEKENDPSEECRDFSLGHNLVVRESDYMKRRTGEYVMQE